MDGLADFHEYSANPELYKFLEYDPFKTIEESRAYLLKLINRSTLENGHYWFIKLEKEMKIIGTFGVLDIDIKKGSAEIGYGLSPEYWGKGYFNEALILVLTYVFKKLQFHRIWAKTQSNNIPSIRALEKCGFTKEGIMRDYYMSSNNVRNDAVILSILRDEFYKHSEGKSTW